ncbi:MAG: hypothetical protein VX223_03045, partial [Myxococcota bacterium]|nr:hypothetical protein [Myxococcota bacterium]
DQSILAADTSSRAQSDVATVADSGVEDTASPSDTMVAAPNDTMGAEPNDTGSVPPEADIFAADTALPEDTPEPPVDDVSAGVDAGTEDTGAAPADAGEDTDDVAGPGQPSMAVGPSLEDCAVVGLLAPSIPSEAGHYAAKVLTPSSYPFAIDGIRYSLLTNNEVITCSGAPAHQVLLFVLDAGVSLPPTPSASGLGYRQYDVPADPSAAGGRNVEITVPIPLILTEGQSAVVAIQFAVDGDAHICVADCQSAVPTVGTDWWSNAATPPFTWQDLVADFSLTTNMPVQITGTDSF